MCVLVCRHHSFFLFLLLSVATVSALSDRFRPQRAPPSEIDDAIRLSSPEEKNMNVISALMTPTGERERERRKKERKGL